MKVYFKVLSIMLITAISAPLIAQCVSWNELINKDELEGDHSVYRQAIKGDDFKTAYEYWQKVYTAAPAADGNRDFHFTDGITIYKHKLKNETDPAKKKEYKDAVVRLYDEAIACYESGGIKLKKCQGDDCIDKKVAFLNGRKGFDMFYDLNSKYSANKEALAKAVEGAGNDTEYILFEPYANILVYQFKNDKVSKEEVVAVHAELNEIADYNIENNEKYGDYYESSKARMNAKFDEIADDIFDCDYFKNKYMPGYEKAPDDFENIKKMYNALKIKGCSPDDPLMKELKVKYESWASKVNAQKQAEFEANNPGVAANKLYKEGKYQEAINKYREAISNETDPQKKAGYHSSIASILFRKMNKLVDARKEARTALKLRPGWGKPLNLIGDMYATGARNCGDSWNQRLAIIAAINKYQAAKNDPEYAQDAQKKINTYRSSLPDSSEGFMRGVSAGDKAKVGCWIGETVTVRYK